MWLDKAIKDYDDLSDAEQAHVDAALDAQDDNHDVCMCGKLIDKCPDAYAHMSSGY